MWAVLLELPFEAEQAKTRESEVKSVREEKVDKGSRPSGRASMSADAHTAASGARLPIGPRGRPALRGPQRRLSHVTYFRLRYKSYIAINCRWAITGRFLVGDQSPIVFESSDRIVPGT
ncbi:hypothetical protein EVAR_58971_1 [Eumeta japonica]|uniref:Uncharacterized protein n=1 Tax=Eumeta variegata TaxID=151549 RepID=A0A4C1YHE7_EUMVA|nr:hypothetical protein EVAR_58971_1 [Eumeta japonica]